MGKSEDASWKEPGVSTGRQDDVDEAAEYGFSILLNAYTKLRVKLTIRAASVVVAKLSPTIFHYKIRVVNR